MKRLFILVLVSFLNHNSGWAQLVKVEPADAGADDQAKIIFDATQGNKELLGATKVYVHTGIVTDSPSGTAWNNVVGNWGQDDGVGEMTKVAGKADEWELTLSPTIREYYSAAENTNIFRLSMVFRSADGNTKATIAAGQYPWGFVASNGDMYVNLNVGNYVTLTKPTESEIFITSGASFTIEATASAAVTSMKIEIDEGAGFEEKSSVTSGTVISYQYSPANSGSVTMKVTAVIGGVTMTDQKEITIAIRTANVEENLPAGMKRGINYAVNDATKATLVLHAPLKEFVYVVGDFNNWAISADYQMKKVPNQPTFWLELTGLTPQQPYVFQYWVDGVIKIGDPFADQVADPWNDQYIPESVFPNLPAYNKTENQIATVLQTGQTPYVWAATESTWNRPNIKDLVIYELLVRDFIGSHDYKDLSDTLAYLKRLGVNAIELMPIMEFEGNESWGYNPSYFFAVDKYYGTKNDLKKFIETAHAQGFAVILDMVLNHAFGQNPWVRMYWDAQNNRPAANSPYFNPIAKHPFNVGYDFNHASADTRRVVDSVNRYWLEEYHFDGYRFDLSKGFTQTDYGDDVDRWSSYDVGRINILKGMANQIYAYDPDAYVILEHFAAGNEEDELAAAGMLSWRNSHGDFRGALQGNGTNITSASTETRIAYMESHDEERQMVDMINGGKQNADYSIRNLEAALERKKLGAAFLMMQPGPKMLWQFGELGYDIGINVNGRTGNKPIPWGEGNLGYYEDELRQYVYDAYAAILKIRSDFPQIFKLANTTSSLNSDLKRIVINHADLKVVLVGNFGITPAAIAANYPAQGTWFDYFSGEEVSSTETNLTVAPGYFRLLTDRKISEGFPGAVEVFTNPVTVSPATFNLDTEITITFDATKASNDGTAGLVGATKVYFHSGLVVDDPTSEDLTKIVGTLSDDGLGQMTAVAGSANKWQIKLTPRQYYSLGANDKAFRIGMYFRNADNSNVGKGFRNRLVYLDIQPDGTIVTIDPDKFYSNQEITLTYDASLGDRKLLNASKIYMHSGVVTRNTNEPQGTDWKYVVGNYGQDDGLGQMTKKEGTDQWQITLTPRSYYAGITAADSIYWLSMVFRNADGSEKGSGNPGDFNGGKIESSGDIFMKVLPPPIVEPPLSISPASGFSIYPNPTRDYLLIKGIPQEMEVQITLTDMQGKSIKKLAQKAGDVIELKDLTIGLYIIRVQSTNHYFERRVIVNE